MLWGECVRGVGGTHRSIDRCEPSLEILLAHPLHWRTASDFQHCSGSLLLDCGRQRLNLQDSRNILHKDLSMR